MEFVTIHNLSRELNIPARVIRYRLLHLIAEGKLKEHEDFRREAFKDDRHFNWKIHPLRFMQETGFKPTTLPPTKASVNNVLTPDNKTVNQNAVVGNQSDNGATRASIDRGQTPLKFAEPSLAREMIDLLKDQIRVKDTQLQDQGEQLKETHELNLKLTGTMLQQSQKIENLMRLTGGKSELEDVVTQNRPFDNSADNQSASSVIKDVNEEAEFGYQTGNEEELAEAA